MRAFLVLSLVSASFLVSPAWAADGDLPLSGSNHVRPPAEVPSVSQHIAERLETRGGTPAPRRSLAGRIGAGLGSCAFELVRSAVGAAIFPALLGTRMAAATFFGQRPTLRQNARLAWYGVLYTAMMISHSHSGLTYHQYEKATPGFTAQAKSDHRLIIDILPDAAHDGFFTANAAHKIYQWTPATGNLLYIRAHDIGEGIEMANERAKSDGIQYTHIDIIESESAGRLWSLNGYLDLADETFKSFPPTTDADPGHRQTNVGPSRWQGKTISDLPEMEFMAAGGQVRWTSCLGGMTVQGEQAMHKLSGLFLRKRGGTYHIARVGIAGNPLELAALKADLMPPANPYLQAAIPAAREVGDWFRAGLSLPMINNNLNHYRQYPDLTPVPHVGPWLRGSLVKTERIEARESSEPWTQAEY